ncbi:hypothetical protein CWI37_0005p0040 [Hamiltosporidium tvaerminnensis]|uniref:Uncharacterized protein n=1 Tax=Hamiltosporidium tvaerminnensis TaxID=1176355 RepID=A0A4Q9LCC2_9MICR|nr:hypothetical protein CWI37_0005p0040 [Hamiltosporidium tvaerminnensis]
MNFERMYMKYLFNILFILKCIKLSNFEREESIDQLVKEISEMTVKEENRVILENLDHKFSINLLVFKGINASFCVPIFSCDREELKVCNKENNSAVSLKKHKFNNLFCKKIIERLIRSNIFIFPETEENESIEIIEVQNELKSKNVDIPQFMMFLIYNSQVKDLADKEYEIINLLSDISEDFVEKIFHKFVDLCFPSFNSKFLEENKKVDEVKNLILSFISKKFIEIHNNSKNIFRTIKYIFKNFYFKFWTFYLQNHEEFQRFLCNPEEKNESEKTCEEKNSIAADKLREKLCEYLLNNKENMCDLLKKVLGGYVSFDEDKNLGIYEEFDNILNIFFHQTGLFLST